MNLLDFFLILLIFRPSFNNQPVKRVSSAGESYQRAYESMNNIASPMYGVSFPSTSANIDAHLNAHVLDKRKEGNTYQMNHINQVTNSQGATSTRTNVPIWCIDCKDNIVVLGCVDGCLEFWECSSGLLKVRRV